MTLLTRYTVKVFLTNFALALAAFVGIFFLVEFFEKIDKFIEKKAALGLYFSYFINAFPLIITQVAPLAVLMAAFTSIGSLSRTGELTAMRAGGLSLFRISRPIIIATCGITLALILSQELLLPRSTRTMNKILEQKIKGLSQPQLLRNKLWVRSGDRIIHIEQVVPREGALQGITIYQMDSDFQIAGRTDAGSAKYIDGSWQFKNLNMRKFDVNSGAMIDSVKSAQQRIDFGKSPEDFQRPEPHEWELNYLELKSLAKKMKVEGYDNTRLLVNMYSHLSAPFSCIVMVLLGIPFALNRGRNTSLSLGIVISVIIGVAYFILHSVSMAFGYSGILPPLLATWSANILVGLCGLWLVLFRTQ